MLAFNRFETVPDALTHMTDFNESLIMAGNRMCDHCHPQVEQFGAVCSVSDIAHLTENLATQLKDLKRIDLRFNDLGLKADEALHLVSFEQLTHLDLRDNRIVELDLRFLQSLEFLSCERNQLQRLQLSGAALRTLLAAHNRK